MATDPDTNDPLIDEVPRRRRELMQKHDNDLRKLFEAIQRRQAEHPEKYGDPHAEKRAGCRRANDEA